MSVGAEASAAGAMDAGGAGTVGFTSAAGATGTAYPGGGETIAGGGGSTGGGMEDMIKQLMNNPEAAKIFKDAASNIGGAIHSIAKIPPEAKAFINKAVQQQQKQKQEQDLLNPYGGDMMRFVTPEMAKGVLDQFGIPYGRMKM